MKPKKIICPTLFKLPLLKEYAGIVIGRFMVFKEEPSPIVLKHEIIHQEQMNKHGVILFYLKYVFYYVILRLKGMGHDQAYRNIPFEKEAYERGLK